MKTKTAFPKNRIYWTVLLLLLLLSLAESIMLLRIWVKDNWKELGFLDINKKAPYYGQVKQIIKPLRYSGIQTLLSDDVYLSFDFEKKLWILHNVFKYSPEGNIILEDGKYGLCGDLAVYTYQHIRPLFDERYEIKYTRVSETDYFMSYMDTHLVLTVKDTSPFLLVPDIYIIDPSFHIYKHQYELDNYLFHESYDKLPSFRKRQTDHILQVNMLLPLMITKQHLVWMTVGDVKGKFDINNYALSILATKRENYLPKNLFLLRKENGRIETVNNDYLAKQIIPRSQHEKLLDKLNKLFLNVKEYKVPLRMKNT